MVFTGILNYSYILQAIGWPFGTRLETLVVVYNKCMNLSDLKIFVQNIVNDAKSLKDKHIDEIDAPVNYACIFSHSMDEFKHLVEIVSEMGEILFDTDKGPVFHITPLVTVAGNLKILKIRKPFKERPERGDADFTIRNYEDFKKNYLGQVGFRLIKKRDFEMVELADKTFDVLAYFSNPPLDEQYNI